DARVATLGLQPATSRKQAKSRPLLLSARDDSFRHKLFIYKYFRISYEIQLWRKGGYYVGRDRLKGRMRRSTLPQPNLQQGRASSARLGGRAKAPRGGWAPQTISRTCSEPVGSPFGGKPRCLNRRLATWSLRLDRPRQNGRARRFLGDWRGDF